MPIKTTFCIFIYTYFFSIYYTKVRWGGTFITDHPVHAHREIPEVFCGLGEMFLVYLSFVRGFLKSIFFAFFNLVKKK